MTTTVTPTRTQSPTTSPTPTPTRTSSPSATPSPSPTSSPTPTASPTPTSTATNTPTPTPIVYGATDSFDRPDSATSLGRADSTQAWQTDGGVWGICADRACPYPSPDTPGNYVRLQTNLTDVRAAVSIVRPDNGSTAQAALLARVADDWSDNQLYVGLDATGFVDVWTLTGGTWNEVASVQTAYSASADRRLEARVVGASLDVYVDGSQVMRGVAVPAAPAGATQAGLFVDTSDPSSGDWAHFDDFEVDRWP